MFAAMFRRVAPRWILLACAPLIFPTASAFAQAPSSSQAIVFKVTRPNERVQMTVNTSRILTLDQKIPQVQVNNPDILEPHILSPNEVQIFAKAQGVTQVNLWGEDEKIYSLDVIVYGDTQSLTMLLQEQFPNSSLKAVPVGSAVLVSGFVDQPEHISRIVEIAEQYYPKVINNMTVAGVQEVVLNVRVMEVSRTKLRTLGFDWAKFTNGNMVFSGVSGLLTASFDGTVGTSGAETFAFSVLGNNSSFFGVLEALRRDNLMKILAEPKLVTTSGRPAFFQVGGEFPILVPQSMGTVSIEYKKFGTQVDFVPIVLGNGRIHLDVRPRVSEIDSSRSIVIDSYEVPGLRVREVETGVEMMAGQTLAIAGLVQTRIEAQNRGLPWASELPYVGSLFRRVNHEENEIELLILVTPELCEAMPAGQTPQGGPGLSPARPNDCDLYRKGHLEVPRCCPSPCGNGGACPNPGPCPCPGAAPEAGMILRQPEVVPMPPDIRPLSSRQDPRATSLPNPGGQARPVRLTSDQTQTADNSQSRYNPVRQQIAPDSGASRQANAEPGFIGPVGYDVK